MIDDSDVGIRKVTKRDRACCANGFGGGGGTRIGVDGRDALSTAGSDASRSIRWINDRFLVSRYKAGKYIIFISSIKRLRNGLSSFFDMPVDFNEQSQ